MKYLIIVLLVACSSIEGGLFNVTSNADSYLQRERRALVSDSEDCRTLKKLVIDVGQSGLGNRMLALVSALQLAIKMNRILELKWNKNRGCDAGKDYHCVVRW